VSLLCSVVWRVVCATLSYSLGIALSKIITCMISGMTVVAAIRHWKCLFIVIILIVGFAMEIFWEITPLNLVKIAKGPVWLKVACKACQMALAVAVLFVTMATEGLTWRRIVP